MDELGRNDKHATTASGRAHFHGNEGTDGSFKILGFFLAPRRLFRLGSTFGNAQNARFGVPRELGALGEMFTKAFPNLLGDEDTLPFFDGEIA